MPIIAASGKSTEALDYINVHLCSLSIIQEYVYDTAMPPEYKVIVNYKLFAIDSLGKRHFETRTRQINVPDYYTTAMAKAAVGDTDLINAMGGIEKALATLIEDLGDVGTTGVIA